MKLSVQLVIWNGEKYLPLLFESLAGQTFKDWELLVWDNGSKDKTVELVGGYSKKIGVPVRTYLKKENSGFAPPHSALFRESADEYVAILNQDIVLENNVFEALVGHLEKHPDCASVGPKLLRLENDIKTNTIDSLGLKINRKRQITDLGADTADIDRQNDAMPAKSVFGVSGAVAIYRRSAVSAVCRKGELFDEAYVSYQEDSDLAWKLRLGGYESKVVVGAKAYHHRGTRESERGSLLKTISNKKSQQLFIRHNSYKNHLTTIYKNEQWQNFLLDLLPIFWYEGAKFFYNLLFDRRVFAVIGELKRERAYFQSERKRIKSITRTSWKEIRRWFR